MEPIVSDQLGGLLIAARRAVGVHQPRLRCRVVDDRVEIFGTYVLMARQPDLAANGPLATYDIRIELLTGFPAAEPMMFELAGAFPHDVDHHVNSDGSCCFGVWELLRVQKPDMTVRDFIDGPVRSFFFSQHYKATTGHWPFGEFSHGNAGLVEAYAELLGCRPDLRIVEGLLRVLSLKWKRDRKPCACSSGKRLRDCCRTRLHLMPKPMGYRDARLLLARLLRHPCAIEHRRTTMPLSVRSWRLPTSAKRVLRSSTRYLQATNAPRLSQEIQ